MISLKQSTARAVGKLSNKLRRQLDMLSSRKEFSGSQEERCISCWLRQRIFFKRILRRNMAYVRLQPPNC